MGTLDKIKEIYRESWEVHHGVQLGCIIAFILMFLSCSGGTSQSRSTNWEDTVHRAPTTLRPHAWLKVVKHYQGRIEQEVLDGDILFDTEYYAIRWQCSRKAYIYIYQVDDQGRVGRLFPNKKFSSYTNPLMANQEYRLPGKKGWLLLKGIPGDERIILLAYPEPLSMPEKVCRRIAAESLGQDSVAYTKVAGIGKLKPDWKTLGVNRDLLFFTTRVFMHAK